MRKITPAPIHETRVCLNCHGSYRCHPREWANNFRKRKYCRQQCAATALGKLKTYLTKIKCHYCNSSFKQRNSSDKFCSKICYWKNKIGKPNIHPKKKVRREKIICPNCGQGRFFRLKEISQKRRYCSRKCYRSIKNKYPENRNIVINQSPRFDKIKLFVKERDGYKCQKCFHDFNKNPKRMIVHHIRDRKSFDGISRKIHPVADDPSNLILVCYRCHQLEHTP